MKIKILITFLFLLSFPLLSHAAIYSSQTNDTASTTATNVGTYYFRMGQSSGTSTANYIGIKIGSMTSTAGDRICLTQGQTQGGLPTNQFDSDTIASTGAVCDHGSGANMMRVLNSSGNPASIRDGEGTYVLDASSTTFKAGYYYMFIIGDAGNGSMQAGNWLKSATTHSVGAGTNTTDAYWCMASTFAEALSCTESTAPEITLTFPGNGSTQENFAFWNASTSNPNGAFLRIKYGATSTPFQYNDGDWLARVGNDSYSKGIFLFTGNYYAQAYLVSSTSDAIVATSSLVNFSVSYGGATGNWNTISTTTFTCDPITNVLDVKNGICHAASFLFIPSTSTIENIAQFGNTVSTTPPYASFFTARNTLKNLGASSTSETFNIAFTMPTSSALQFSLTLYSTSSANAYITPAIASKIRLIIGYIVWVDVLILVYLQGKTLTNEHQEK